MAWLFPSVIIEGIDEESAKAVYAVAMEEMTSWLATTYPDASCRWDEGCEKIEDAEVVE